MIKGSISIASWMSQIIMITMIFPFISPEKKKNVKNTIVYTVIFIGFLNTLVAIVTLKVYGLETKELYFPVYNVAKLIEIDILWRRLDVIIMSSWVVGVTMKMIFWFYCTVMALKHIFAIERHEPLVLSTALLVFTVANYATSNSAELAYYLGYVYPLFSLLSYELVIPLLLCAVIFVRKIRGRPT